MKKYKKVMKYTVIYASLPIFLLSTNPDKLPLPLVITPFVLLFGVLFFTATKILSASKGESGEYRRHYLLAGIVSGFPVLVLVLQSLHQLSWKDGLIVGGLIIGSAWYLRRLNLYKAISV